MNWLVMLCGCGAILMVGLALHPFVTYPLSLWLLRLSAGGRRQAGAASASPDNASHFHKLSVAFCAYNEAAVVEEKLGNLLALVDSNPAKQVELLAYCDASSDGTGQILSGYADRVRVFCGATRRGKSHGMNTLLSQASGELVIFTDANVLLDMQVIEAICRAFADSSVGVVCGHLRYVNSDTATAGVGTDYWRLEELIKQLETDTGSTIGADGSIFAIRRQLWAPVPEDIIDDFYTSMRILCEGYRVVRCSDAIAYERSVDAFAQERARKTRIACRAFNCHRLLAPARAQLSWLNKYKYLSHKWMRWLTVTWLGCALVCGLAAIGLSFGLWVAAASVWAIVFGLGALWLGQRLNIPVLSKLWVVLMSLWATQLGVWQSLMGYRYQTWTPAQSARLGFEAHPVSPHDSRG